MMGEQAGFAGGHGTSHEQGGAPPTGRGRLYRSRDDRMIAGVAGGLAQYFGVEPVLVRLGFVLLGVSTGIGVLAYITLALLTPERPAGEAEPAAVASFATGNAHGRETAAYLILAMGIIFLTGNLGWFNVIHWGVIWPLALIASGLFLLYTYYRERQA